MVRRAAFAVLLLGVTLSLRRAARRGGAEAPARNGRVHAHECFLCEGRWRHRGPCPEGRAWLCPWCVGNGRADATARARRSSAVTGANGAARRGRHVHRCPRCLTTWIHRGAGTGACTAGDQAALPGCPGCRSRRPAPPLLPRA